MRRGAAFRRVRARTLRNEESKMCHTSRVALYKLKSARACFGAAFCFGLCLFPTARDRGGAGRPNLNFKLKGDSRDFFHFTRHYFFRRNIGKFYNEVLWITRL